MASIMCLQRPLSLFSSSSLSPLSFLEKLVLRDAFLTTSAPQPFDLRWLQEVRATESIKLQVRPFFMLSTNPKWNDPDNEYFLWIGGLMACPSVPQTSSFVQRLLRNSSDPRCCTYFSSLHSAVYFQFTPNILSCCWKWSQTNPPFTPIRVLIECWDRFGVFKGFVANKSLKKQHRLPSQQNDVLAFFRVRVKSQKLMKLTLNHLILETCYWPSLTKAKSKNRHFQRELKWQHNRKKEGIVLSAKQAKMSFFLLLNGTRQKSQHCAVSRELKPAFNVHLARQASKKKCSFERTNKA